MLALAETIRMNDIKQTVHDLVNKTITVNYIKREDYKDYDVKLNPYDYTKYDHDGNLLKESK